jgi:hypothetical protein
MVSLDLRKAWAKTAYNYCFSKNGLDFTPEEPDMRRYLGQLFKRKALQQIDDSNLGQSIDLVMDALSTDSDKDKYTNRQEAAVLLDTLEAHVSGEVEIPKMRLMVSDGMTP